MPGPPGPESSVAMPRVSYFLPVALYDLRSSPICFVNPGFAGGCDRRNRSIAENR
jgi:hypothetical protein